jgi:hypothetical protein
MGASRVKLEIEVKPLGTDFDAQPDASAFWYSLSPTGIPLFATPPGLVADKAYHWRARIRSFPHWTGPWFSKGPNGDGETDFRTP